MPELEDEELEEGLDELLEEEELLDEELLLELLELLDEDEPPVEELPPLVPFLAIPEGVVISLGID